MFYTTWLLISIYIISIIKFNKADLVVYEKETLQTGRVLYIYSPGYRTGGYTGGNSYRWTVEGIGYLTINCVMDTVSWPDNIVVKTSEADTGLSYYGKDSFTASSTTTQLILILNTIARSPGGRFYCQVYSKCLCGWKYPWRITMGQQTDINEFPMMAALTKTSHMRVPGKGLFCGATIINTRQVITAAHCIKYKQIDEMKVLVGDHNLYEDNDTDASFFYAVQSKMLHPQYNENTHANDIAIINVAQSITFHQRVGPVCLPFQNQWNLFADQQVTLLGWGTTDTSDGMSHFLRKADVQVMQNNNCARVYSSVSSNQLCTIHPERDSCQGDSGGPILWHDPVSRRLFLVGVISVGGMCGDGNPVVNTRITPYIGWIEDNKHQETQGFCKTP